ncbi:MAG: hypothetical protein KIT72_11305 [Polyangiaceae bacterium]|nr:hypothetical protein [Polyangiaceae bacterium]MCW5790999.1 hypothetical protein [Polyangiaceae bacterium]
MRREHSASTDDRSSNEERARRSVHRLAGGQSGALGRFARRLTVVSLAALLGSSLTSGLTPSVAFAQSTSARQQAAARYDEGVEAFDAGDFARAAAAFMAADELAPSSEALANALTAAVRAGDHLLVVRVAERATTRAGVDAEVVAQARRAQAYAASKLAQLLLSCEPAPCGLTLDGAVVKAGTHYVLPGNHSVVAVARDGHRSSRALDLSAGTSYRVQMYATAAGEAARAPELQAERGGVVAAPEAGMIIRDFPSDSGSRSQPDAGLGLPPWVFFTGVGLSAVAVGLTAVSGMDALQAKDELSSRPTVSERDAVQAKITRTDVLVGVSLGLAVLTTYLGVFQVDWGGTEVGVGPGWVSARAHF